MKLLELLKSSRPSDLEVIVDNQATLKNVNRFLRKNNYEVSYKEEDVLWRISAHTDAASSVAGDSMHSAAPKDRS